MLYNFCFVFLIFIIFSFLGYLVEVGVVSFYNKKINFSRGFLIGPYLPIYGAGSILMIFLLDKYENDLLALFILSMFLCTALEYFTSLILEKIFKLRWWDYSKKKYNIEGRVCLKNAFLFGFGGIFVVKIAYPLIRKFLLIFPRKIICILGVIIFVAFMVDLIISVLVLVRLKINVTKYINVDATAKIKKEVKLSLEKYVSLTTRLLKSFPNIQTENSKAFRTFKGLIEKTRLEVKKIKKQRKNN